MLYHSKAIKPDRGPGLVEKSESLVVAKLDDVTDAQV